MSQCVGCCRFRSLSDGKNSKKKDLRADVTVAQLSSKCFVWLPPQISSRVFIFCAMLLFSCTRIHKRNEQSIKQVHFWWCIKKKVHNVVSYLCVALRFDAGEPAHCSYMWAALRWQPVIVAGDVEDRLNDFWIYHLFFLNVRVFQKRRWSRPFLLCLHRAIDNPSTRQIGKKKRKNGNRERESVKT